MNSLKTEQKRIAVFAIIIFLKVFCFYFFTTTFSYKTYFIENIHSVETFFETFFFSKTTLKVLALCIETCISCVVLIFPFALLAFTVEKRIRKEIRTEYIFYATVIASCFLISYSNGYITHAELYLCYLTFLPYEKLKIIPILKQNKSVFIIWSIAALMIGFVVLVFKYLNETSPNKEYTDKLKVVTNKENVYTDTNSKDDDVSILYSALIKKGYSTDAIGTEDIFREKLSKEKNRGILYNYILSRGDFRIGSYKQYEERISKCYGQTTAKKHVLAKVYICTGNSATVYHKYKDCKGLNRCRSKVKAVTTDEAKRMGRRECRICY